MTTLTLDITQNSANAIYDLSVRSGNTVLSYTIYDGYFGAQIDNANTSSSLKTWSTSKHAAVLANTNSSIRTKMSVANTNAQLANTNSFIKSQLANTNSWIESFYSSAKSSASATDKILAEDGYYTPSLLAQYALAYNAGIKTANAPILNLSEVWNNGAVAFTGLKYDVTDTASLSTSLLMDLQVGGATKFNIRKDGRITAYSTLQTNNSTIPISVGQNAVMYGEATNVLALRNGVNAQAFRLYNTYTDASNYERGGFTWSANDLVIGTANAGTGIARNLVAQAASSFYFGGNNGTQWRVNTSGHLITNSDNAYDIGASGANRPRNLFLANQLTVGSHITMGSGAQLSAAGAAALSSPADGVWRMMNNAGTDFGRLCFGPATSSFPALKRNGAVLQAKTADDADFTRFDAKVLGVVDGMTAPGAVVGYALIFVDAADGDLKVRFGDGTLKTIVTDT